MSILLVAVLLAIGAHGASLSTHLQRTSASDCARSVLGVVRQSRLGFVLCLIGPLLRWMVVDLRPPDDSPHESRIGAAMIFAWTVVALALSCVHPLIALGLVGCQVGAFLACFLDGVPKLLHRADGAVPSATIPFDTAPDPRSSS